MKKRKLIEDLYASAQSKRNEARENIIKNEDRIREIDAFLSSAKDKEMDIRFFSPRGIDEEYDGRIRRESDERSLLIGRNENLFNLVNDLDLQIEQFKELLKELEDEPEETLTPKKEDTVLAVSEDLSEEENPADSVSALTDDRKFISELEDIKGALETVGNHLYQDVHYAKIELDAVISKIDDLIERAGG